jgi:hypothetical protein
MTEQRDTIFARGSFDQIWTYVKSMPLPPLQCSSMHLIQYLNLQTIAC